MEWKPVTSQAYWALNPNEMGYGYVANSSGLWVPDKPYMTTSANTTFLPDNVYQSAVADVEHYFETGDFMVPNGVVYIPPKPKPAEVTAQMLGYYSLKSSEPYEHVPSTRGILTELFPGLDHMLDCPECDNFDDDSEPRCSLTDLIIHLNDGHEWSREQIADWLETLPVDLTLATTSKGD